LASFYGLDPRFAGLSINLKDGWSSTFRTNESVAQTYLTLTHFAEAVKRHGLHVVFIGRAGGSNP
jgi:hypothetical protein